MGNTPASAVPLDQPLAATSDRLHLLLTTPCPDVASAMRRYEIARDDATQVTEHGWLLLAAELRKHAAPGPNGRAARDRAESCDARALTARVLGPIGNA